MSLLFYNLIKLFFARQLKVLTKRVQLPKHSQPNETSGLHKYNNLISFTSDRHITEFAITLRPSSWKFNTSRIATREGITELWPYNPPRPGSWKKADVKNSSQTPERTQQPVPCACARTVPADPSRTPPGHRHREQRKKREAWRGVLVRSDVAPWANARVSTLRHHLHGVHLFSESRELMDAPRTA